jgi:small subunit ribosomal protein S4
MSTVKPKNKLSRRAGRELFRKEPSKRLNQAPGQHGNSRTKSSEYALQLREKQAIKQSYGLREKQFRNYYEEAKRISSNKPELRTGEVLLQLLETRLDNTVFRLGLSNTRRQARQLVTQGHILVNGNSVNKPSFQVKEGMSIQLVDKLFENPFFREILQKTYKLPEWLEIKGRQGFMTRKPVREDIDQNINENLVVAFYTRN